MIEALTATASTSLMDTVRRITQTQNDILNVGTSEITKSSSAGTPDFGEMLSGLIRGVDEKSKASQAVAKDLMTGRTCIS